MSCFGSRFLEQNLQAAKLLVVLIRTPLHRFIG